MIKENFISRELRFILTTNPIIYLMVICFIRSLFDLLFFHKCTILTLLLANMFAFSNGIILLLFLRFLEFYFKINEYPDMTQKNVVALLFSFWFLTYELSLLSLTLT
jgi:hypothetical protein